MTYIKLYVDVSFGKIGQVVVSYEPSAVVRLGSYAFASKGFSPSPHVSC